MGLAARHVAFHRLSIVPFLADALARALAGRPPPWGSSPRADHPPPREWADAPPPFRAPNGLDVKAIADRDTLDLVAASLDPFERPSWPRFVARLRDPYGERGRDALAREASSGAIVIVGVCAGRLPVAYGVLRRGQGWGTWEPLARAQCHGARIDEAVAAFVGFDSSRD